MKSGIKNTYWTLLIFSLFSCRDPGKATTPTNYKYIVPGLTMAEYSDDTLAIRNVITRMFVEQVNPFDLEIYDAQTDVFIDSAIYSPDRLRMIIFLIARNSTTKLLQKENDSIFFYNAYYLFSSRESLDSPIKIYDYTGYSLINFYNKEEIRGALREYCFSRLLKLEGNERHYNIDDIRFWNSELFQRVLNNSKATTE